ncbi:unnamed protein product [Lathyrus sativus]|nr:unnamed protein product [Lathyrus sativus]
MEERKRRKKTRSRYWLVMKAHDPKSNKGKSLQAADIIRFNFSQKSTIFIVPILKGKHDQNHESIRPFSASLSLSFSPSCLLRLAFIRSFGRFPLRLGFAVQSLLLLPLLVDGLMFFFSFF